MYNGVSLSSELCLRS